MLNFSTISTRASGHDETIQRILHAALQAVDPYDAVIRAVSLSGDLLTIGKQSYDLSNYANVFVIGTGKAGSPMVKAINAILGDRVIEGLVITKDGYAQSAGGSIQILESAHPVPDERGVQATHQLIKILQKATSRDLVIALISGGGSALMTSPAEGISLGDIQHLTRLLLASGANIQEINALRKHLDTVKGGGIARLAAPAALAALILSDVIGDPLDVIASGPTVPDSSTFEDAWKIIEKYHLAEKILKPIHDHLLSGVSGSIPDTPKPGDPIFQFVQNVIVASNFQAASAAMDQSDAEGIHASLLTTYFQGEARMAGPWFAAIAQQINATSHPIPRPALVIAGGETTVTLSGTGLGGRNQELALSAVKPLAGLKNLVLVCLATDGGDGPTDAAGAVVTGESFSRGLSLGLAPEVFLSQNDSYHYFEPLGDLLLPGPTLTNVNDLTFLFVF
jgi:glycerate 2-kinase